MKTKTLKDLKVARLRKRRVQINAGRSPLLRAGSTRLLASRKRSRTCERYEVYGFMEISDQEKTRRLHTERYVVSDSAPSADALPRERAVQVLRVHRF